jgi:alpha-tubulin suppressor-like RCC1 family protein
MGGLGDTHLPTAVPGVGNVMEITCGEAHTCLLDRDGRVWCWGRSGWGETGSVATEVFPPRQVTGVVGATEVRAGRNHTCAVAGGDLRCWGRNDEGQLGRSTFGGRLSAAAGAAPGATFHAAGGHHTCVNQLEGFSNTVRCWGRNDKGQLGRGDNVWSARPAAPTGLSFIGGLALGEGHTCARHVFMLSGKIFCWGDNGKGQLAQRVQVTEKNLPTEVASFSPGLTLAAGARHTCSTNASGALHCWGDNAEGQLGDNTTTIRYLPTAVTWTRTAALVVAGHTHTCAVTDRSTAWCWGQNRNNQLANRLAGNRSTIPVECQGL